MKTVELNRLNYSEIIDDFISSKTYFDKSLQQTVEKIIERVKSGGDEALIQLTKELDGVDISEKSLRVSSEQIENAVRIIPNDLRIALEKSIENIRSFHLQEVPESWSTTDEMGVMLGQKVGPIDRAGIYAPGGKARYPSSVIMNSVPATVAGVKSIALCSPPDAKGDVAVETLAAASLCGIDEVYRIGGAQAMAALAIGTKSIPKVDKITGPGNIYVTLAKKELFGLVGIDMLAGPSEIVVIADKQADAEFIASDLMAQAEHGESSISILITDSADLAAKVQKEIDKSVKNLPRYELIVKSLNENGMIFVCDSLDLCFEVSNLIAPEHLEVQTENPLLKLDQITNAGAIFLGRYTPVSVGDYYAGPNHVLPTSTTARFSSGLGVNDFIKRSSVINYTRGAIKKASRYVMMLASTEGLEAHAASIEVRLRETGSGKED